MEVKGVLWRGIDTLSFSHPRSEPLGMTRLGVSSTINLTFGRRSRRLHGSVSNFVREVI